MLTSVVVRTKDEGPRLRLTLASLARQTARVEVVVVNDGSSDETPAVLDEARASLDLVVVTHASARGRSAASNAGAKAAHGDLVVFLDGDTLAAPDTMARHIALHEDAPQDRWTIARGEKFHFRSTRFLHDPEAGTPRRGEEERVARLSVDELGRMKVTRAMIHDDFGALARRAEHGIYPGAGPRRLQEIELDALRRHPECAVLWAAACGSNLSMRRDAFLAVGGFNEAIDCNEHRELALKLCERGARMALVEGARAYHLTHRSGWRDPLRENRWEQAFWHAHPLPAVKLLSVFWACIDLHPAVPPDARIASLPELEAAARGERGVDYDDIRRRLGLPGLALPPITDRAGAATGPATAVVR
ncbi:MAG: glycosyltransferase family 2 protein [Betaproteobacteria bacterium]